MRKRRMRGLCLALLTATAAAGAADPQEGPEDKALVEVDEQAPMLSTPKDDAKPIATLEPGTRLVLVSHRKYGEYWRVVRVDRGPVGWVDSGKTKFIRGKEDDEDKDEPEFDVCADVLDACPARGCAKEGDGLALANEQKRRAPEGASPVSLSFEDFATLQRLADERVGQGPPDLDAAGRARLKGLAVSGGAVSEGALVRTFGYLAKGGPGLHYNTHGEPVNCNLKGKAANDIHIPLVAKPGDSEFQGLVVEMVPQKRPEGWTVDALEKVRDEGREVLVEGGLFYDKEHYVSDFAEQGLRADPNRATLWEIHPITKFLVCRKEKCDRSDERDWEAL